MFWSSVYHVRIYFFIIMIITFSTVSLTHVLKKKLHREITQWTTHGTSPDVNILNPSTSVAHSSNPWVQVDSLRWIISAPELASRCFAGLQIRQGGFRVVLMLELGLVLMWVFPGTVDATGWGLVLSVSVSVSVSVRVSDLGTADTSGWGLVWVLVLVLGLVCECFPGLHMRQGGV